MNLNNFIDKKVRFLLLSALLSTSAIQYSLKAMESDKDIVKVDKLTMMRSLNEAKSLIQDTIAKGYLGNGNKNPDKRYDKVSFDNNLDLDDFNTIAQRISDSFVEGSNGVRLNINDALNFKACSFDLIAFNNGIDAVKKEHEKQLKAIRDAFYEKNLDRKKVRDFKDKKIELTYREILKASGSKISYKKIKKLAEDDNKSIDEIIKNQEREVEDRYKNSLKLGSVILEINKDIEDNDDVTKYGNIFRYLSAKGKNEVDDETLLSYIESVNAVEKTIGNAELKFRILFKGADKKVTDYFLNIKDVINGKKDHSALGNVGSDTDDFLNGIIDFAAKQSGSLPSGTGGTTLAADEEVIQTSAKQAFEQKVKDEEDDYRQKTISIIGLHTLNHKELEYKKGFRFTNEEINKKITDLRECYELIPKAVVSYKGKGMVVVETQYHRDIKQHIADLEAQKKINDMECLI